MDCEFGAMADPTELPIAGLTNWLNVELPWLQTSDGWDSELMAGGLSNLTYRIRTSAHTVVLRRPPLGGTIKGAHDMVREFKVLDALASSEMPVPRALALCTDKSILGSDFYVMDEVHGIVLRSAVDSSPYSLRARRAISADFVRALGQLHSLDVAMIGLSNMGRHDGYVVRQLNRWSEQTRQTAFAGSKDMEALVSRLERSVPPQRKAALVHGDYKIDNTMFSNDTDHPKLLSIFDWELATLGDPLADLGLAIAYWHAPGDSERAKIPVANEVTALKGFYSAVQFADEYAKSTHVDLSDLNFYQAFGCFKLAAILAGVQSRLSGRDSQQSPDFTEAVPILLSRGLKLAH
jgi:aminoglycoside phosphotransferase (APT) family kinase protein